MDDKVVAALKKAKADAGVIEAAQQHGSMAHTESTGWTVEGYRGSVMSAKQERAFERALAG